MSDDVKELFRYNGNISEKNTEHLNNFGIVVSNATAKWKNNQTITAFENINLTVQPDRLVAIIGPVGAGKVFLNSLSYHLNILWK